MGLRPWEFERVESVRDFHLMLDGAIWAHRTREDLAGLIALNVLLAGGVTFPERPAATPPKANAPTFEKLMGRPPTPFFDAPDPTAEEKAEAEEKQRTAAARLALAQMQVWEATMRRAHPDRVVDPSGDPEAALPAAGADESDRLGGQAPGEAQEEGPDAEQDQDSVPT